jgi:hypothetical protein
MLKGDDPVRLTVRFAEYPVTAQRVVVPLMTACPTAVKATINQIPQTNSSFLT